MSATPNLAPVREGEILDGKYRIERVLGAGGIGVVVAALHLQLDRRVALKFLLPEILGNREIVARFAQEARAAAKLRSEHVARVLDVGQLATGAPYMVMEYLEGSDLSHLVRARGPLPVEEVALYVLQACEAIAEAHALGIVHRDLKPANLFLTTRADGTPCVKVLDFGISKSTMAMESLSAVSLTSSSAVVGTPLYMSPEQMQSARGVDARADIWSLGAILHELLQGAPPFAANTLPELCIAVMQQTPTPLHQVRDDVPEALADVILRCLAKERAARFQTVLGLAEALAPFAALEHRRLVKQVAGVSNPPTGREAPTSDIGTDTTLHSDTSAASVVRTPPSVSRRTPALPGSRPAFPAWAVVATTVVLVAGALGAVWMLRKDDAMPAATVVPSSPAPSARPPLEPGPVTGPGTVIAAGPVIAPASAVTPSLPEPTTAAQASARPSTGALPRRVEGRSGPPRPATSTAKPDDLMSHRE